MKRYFAIFTVCMSVMCSYGANYLVSTKQYGAAGTQVTHRGQTFEVGTTVFTSLSEALAANIPAGSTVYVDAGTYAENVTINVQGLALLGNNAYGDARANTRVNAESVITGKWTIAANDITVNGFQWTGAGCIENLTATNTAPLAGFAFLYNDVRTSSLAHGSSVLYFGKGYKAADAQAATAHCRYSNFRIAHNAFAGSATNMAAFITLSGSFGATQIADNTFNDGGGSITLNNAQGAIDIDGNIFNNVGDPTRVFGSTYGEFAIYLYYFAHSNSTTVNICNNVFDNCQGRSGQYSTIRLFNGDKPATEGNVLTPVNCTVHVNHNIFRNKPMLTGKTHNYVLYTNYIPEASIDTRFNEFDLSSHEFAQVKQPWETEAQRNYASSYEEINFAKSADTEYGYWTDPLGGQVKDLKLEKSGRVAQSFDIDDKTGDMFFVQIYPKSEHPTWTFNKKIYTFKHDEPMVLTRYYVAQDANGKDYMRQQRSYLDMAGHCQNMAVCWYKGVRYIVTGGDGKTTDTQSDCTSFIPWQAGVYVDLSPGNTQFSYYNESGVATKHFEVIKFYNHLGKGNPYPAVDNTSQIFCERNTSGANVRFCFYHLGDVIENPTGAQPIKEITIKKYYNGVNGDGTNTGNIGSQDHGFQTWPPQGFTVSGDYLYHFEGVGEGNADAIDNQPTCIIHVHNWKTDQHVYRKRIMKSDLLAFTWGEPEGIKVHRDADGIPCLVCGIATGTSGARTETLVKYTPSKTYAYTIPVGQSIPTVSALEFTTSNTAAVSPQTFTLDNSIVGGGAESTLNGAIQLTLSGADAACFSLSSEHTGAFDQTSKVLVGFTPKATQKDYAATLRISSPNAADVLIPITAKNNISMSTEGATVVETSDFIHWNGEQLTIPTDALSVQIYNLAGQLCSQTTEIAELSAGVYVVRCTTPRGVITSKIRK